MAEQSQMSEGPPAGTDRQRWVPVVVFVLLLCLIVAVAIVILSFDWPLSGRVDPRTQNANVGGDITRIAARVAGYVRLLPVQDNQVVHRGDLIAVIDDADYRAQRDQAQASLDAAKAQVAALADQQGELDAQIGEVRTSEIGSRADIGRTGPELARQQALARTALGESRLLQQAQANQRKMLAGVEAAHAQVGVRLKQVDTLAAQHQQAEAMVQVLQAELALTQLNLDWTRVVAPVDGTLGVRAARPGDLVQPGTTLVTVTPLSGVWLDANLTERQIPGVRIGDAARVELDSFPGRILGGRVVGLAPVTASQTDAMPADNTTGNFTKVVQRITARIAIDWADPAWGALRGLVRPGMSAEVTVLTGRPPAAGS